MKRTNLLILVFSLLVCQLAGGIGAFFTFSSVTSWYPLLNKPWFTPPGWLFGPVWTILFVLMGIALYLVIIKGRNNKYFVWSLVAFGVQLVLNVVWSVMFFGLRSPAYALVVLLILWGFIVITIAFFRFISRTAAWCLVPYLLWVSFAGVLNYYIMILNY